MNREFIIEIDMGGGRDPEYVRTAGFTVRSTQFTMFRHEAQTMTRKQANELAIELNAAWQGFYRAKAVQP
jgi:hypothetical protein